MSTLPHRFTESAFRRYERTIAQFVEVFPSALHVSPSSFGLASETVRGRLRDAFDSYRSHGWPSALINHEKFLSIPFDEVKVSLSPEGEVFIGTADAIKSQRLGTPSVLPISTEAVDLTHYSSDTILGVVAYLAHHSGLAKKVRVRCSANQVEKITENYDVVFEPQTDGTYYLS